jgi:serine/threonine-protein kinase HipA
MGTRGMGALEFLPSIEPSTKLSQSIEISSLVRIAKEILENRKELHFEMDQDDEDKKEALRQLIQVGTSAGGARAKAVIAYHQKTGEIRSGQADVPEGFTHYLMKFDGFSGTGV